MPVPPLDDPKQIAVEVAELMGIDEITVHHISTDHRLPRTKTVPDRLIVKFVHRDMQDKFYASRGQLIGKTAKDLPLIKAEFGTSITTDSKIYINESLTRYRLKLFGRVNEFHKENKWKHVWTVNGKILLRQFDRSEVFTFTTDEEFDDFIKVS